jgi:hypothetical protein
MNPRSGAILILPIQNWSSFHCWMECGRIVSLAQRWTCLLGDRERTTVIKEREREPRETTVIKERDREPDRKVIIDRDRN